MSANTTFTRSNDKTYWFAVRVRVRCEESIASVLRDKKFDVISPMFTEFRQYSDRIRKRRCALFPGYVFVAMNPEKMLHLVSTVGVHYVVRSGTVVQPLSDKEIHAVQALCQIDAEQTETCRPCSPISIGQKVRIEAGPLMGLEGILIRVKEVDRVIVTVESLNSSVSIEISHTQIRVLNEALNSDDIHLSKQE